ncbi:hypothetical protein [Phenylobacterium sp.]|uniref:hypothetical protein n=1 Tax=Phenylobacterium sp. TaxID=1871053 RepID=UPI0035C79B32
MSFTENDRKVRSKSGRVLPDESYQGVPYSAAIADALASEFGSVRAAVKNLARLTNTNERAVRNWFDGKNGPSGKSLIRLMQHSDATFGVVLGLCRRSRSPEPALAELRIHLAAALVAIDAIHQPAS